MQYLVYLNRLLSKVTGSGGGESMSFSIKRLLREQTEETSLQSVKDSASQKGLCGLDDLDVQAIVVMATGK